MWLSLGVQNLGKEDGVFGVLNCSDSWLGNWLRRCIPFVKMYLTRNLSYVGFSSTKYHKQSWEWIPSSISSIGTQLIEVSPEALVSNAISGRIFPSRGDRPQVSGEMKMGTGEARTQVVLASGYCYHRLLWDVEAKSLFQHIPLCDVMGDVLHSFGRLSTWSPASGTIWDV